MYYSSQASWLRLGLGLGLPLLPTTCYLLLTTHYCPLTTQAAHGPHLPPANFLDQGPVNGASGLGDVGDMMIEVDRAL